MKKKLINMFILLVIGACACLAYDKFFEKKECAKSCLSKDSVSVTMEPKNDSCKASGVVTVAKDTTKKHKK